MARRSVIRASDIERDAAADRLRHATAEGRILASELEHRLSLALRAKTIGELDALVADLPGIRRRPARPSAIALVGYGAGAVVVLAVLAVAALVIAGLFAAWVVWMIVLWWAFGHRHGGGRPQRGRHRHGPPPLHPARRGLL